MMQGYIKSMLTFAEANRNVHKELKSKLKNTGLVLSQFVKIRNTRVKLRTTKPNNVQVDIDIATDKSAKSPAESSVATNTIIDIIRMQGEAIDKLACQVESIRLQQQQCQPQHSMEDGGTWTDVVRRRPTTRKQAEHLGKNRDPEARSEMIEERGKNQVTGKKQTNQNHPPTRRQPPALLVLVKDGEYTNILKKVRNSDEVKVVADKITALTKTKSGDLLVRVNPGQEGMAP